jgi:phospholipid/cholesterol/gamma-HCH transport system substrate-binding protein
MMQRTTLDLWVGIFVAIGIGALVFLSIKVANVTTALHGESYTVNARFSNLGGLKPQAPVKSAGVVVGRVHDISFDNETFEAKVSLSLEKRYEFPKDTAAKILTAGLLGDQYIDLSAGGDPDILVEGDTLELTQSAVVLENLIGQFMFNKAAEGKKE